MDMCAYAFLAQDAWSHEGVLLLTLHMTLDLLGFTRHNL